MCRWERKQFHIFSTCVFFPGNKAATKPTPLLLHYLITGCVQVTQISQYQLKTLRNASSSSAQPDCCWNAACSGEMTNDWTIVLLNMTISQSWSKSKKVEQEKSQKLNPDRLTSTCQQHVTYFLRLKDLQKVDKHTRLFKGLWFYEQCCWLNYLITILIITDYFIVLLKDYQKVEEFLKVL